MDFAQFRMTLRRMIDDGDIPPIPDADTITAATKMSDLGLDSVGKLTMLMAVQEAFDCELGPEAVSDEMTVGGLITLIEKAGGVLDQEAAE